MSDDSGPDSYDVTAQWTTAPDRNLVTLTCKSREPREAQDIMDTLKPIIDERLDDESLIAELEQLADEFIRQRTGDAAVDQAFENAGSRIYRLLADYRGDEGE